MSEASRPPEGALTLERGLSLLQAVADAPDAGLTIVDLSASIGVSRAAVYRLLVPLAERGLVWRQGSRVRLGLGLLELANAVRPVLRRAALPVLRELADGTGLTAHLTLADGHEAMAVAVVEPAGATFHVGYREGARHAITLGAGGRAILAATEGVEWVGSSGELQQGAHGVAAAVTGVPGLRASIGVIGLSPLHQEQAARQAMQAVREFTAVMTNEQ